MPIIPQHCGWDKLKYFHYSSILLNNDIDMKHSLPPLDGFKVFEAAARYLSFSKAADELCITKGAVSYQIKQLEQSLEYPLFRRTTRQVYLTESGQMLYQEVSRLLNDLQQSLARIRPSDRVDISIAATTYVAARWLSPRVARFLEQHPETSIRFFHEVNGSSFALDQVDIAMLWSTCDDNPPPEALLTIPMPLFPVASRSLANALQRGDRQLDKVPLLSEKRSQDHWLEWFERDVLPNPRQVIEDANVRVQAAIDGQGLILADAMMQAELDAGALVAPFQAKLHGYGYHILSAKNRRVSAQVEEMRLWLCGNTGTDQ